MPNKIIYVTTGGRLKYLDPSGNNDEDVTLAPMESAEIATEVLRRQGLIPSHDESLGDANQEEVEVEQHRGTEFATLDRVSVMERSLRVEIELRLREMRDITESVSALDRAVEENCRQLQAFRESAASIDQRLLGDRVQILEERLDKMVREVGVVEHQQLLTKRIENLESRVATPAETVGLTGEEQEDLLERVNGQERRDHDLRNRISIEHDRITDLIPRIAGLEAWRERACS